MTSIQKICTRCKNSYPATTEHFTANARYADGFVTWCKSCFREYRAENKERLQRQNRERYLANQDENIENARQYRRDNKEVVNARDQQRYYEKMQDPERREKERLRRNKTGRKNGPPRIKRLYLPKPPKPTLPKVFNFKSQVRTCTKCGETSPATLAYFNAHKASGGLSSWCIDCHRNVNRVNNEQARQQGSARRDESPRMRLRDAVNTHRRRAQRLGAIGEFTIDDIEFIQIEQHDRCIYCQIPLRNKGEIEHIIPLTRGGHNWQENIALACLLCNRSKGNKLPSEWDCLF